jgi:hypothetical protein
MTVPSDKIAELRLKHLEMLHTVVARMAGYGATGSPSPLISVSGGPRKGSSESPSSERCIKIYRRAA